MTTLDDKLLGEKLQNYCSSSSEDEEDENEDKAKSTKSGLKFIPESELKERDRWTGSSQNTGPKGVIKDWQRYKQLQNEKHKEAQAEREKLIKKLAITCRSDDLDQEMEKEQISKPCAAKKMEDEELDDLNDGFFEEYLKKKLEEMQKKILTLPRFGKVIELTGEIFLHEIDNENPNVTVMVHIYDTKLTVCNLMNECLESIARDYSIVKICRIKSTSINVSDKFRKMGCPALLIYKNKEMIGNFVRMNDEFGDEFCASDVENFLLEQGFLPSQEVPSIIRDKKLAKDQSDSDD